VDYNDFTNWWSTSFEPIEQSLSDYLNSLFLLADKDLADASIEQSFGESLKLAKGIKKDWWQVRLMKISRQIASLETNTEISEDKRELEINILLGEAEELSQNLGALEN
jgi:hypothetical protein